LAAFEIFMRCLMRMKIIMSPELRVIAAKRARPNARCAILAVRIAVAAMS